MRRRRASGHHSAGGSRSPFDRDRVSRLDTPAPAWRPSSGGWTHVSSRRAWRSPRAAIPAAGRQCLTARSRRRRRLPRSRNPRAAHASSKARGLRSRPRAVTSSPRSTRSTALAPALEHARRRAIRRRNARQHRRRSSDVRISRARRGADRAAAADGSLRRRVSGDAYRNTRSSRRRATPSSPARASSTNGVAVGPRSASTTRRPGLPPDVVDELDAARAGSVTPRARGWSGHRHLQSAGRHPRLSRGRGRLRALRRGLFAIPRATSSSNGSRNTRLRRAFSWCARRLRALVGF